MKKLICYVIGHNWTSPAGEGAHINLYKENGRITKNTILRHSELFCKRCKVKKQNKYLAKLAEDIEPLL
jgi:hypothetical protein